MICFVVMGFTKIVEGFFILFCFVLFCFVLLCFVFILLSFSYYFFNLHKSLQPQTQTKTNNSKYEGEFKQDHMNGLGELTFVDGSYAGEFKKGEFDGVGVREWNDGRYYKGSWKKVRKGRGGGRLFWVLIFFFFH